MSSIKGMQLRAQESLALNSALMHVSQLANIRAQQVIETEKWSEEMRSDTLRAEKIADDLMDLVTKICGDYSIRAAGCSPMAQLGRISEELLRLNNETRLGEYARLVQLCLTARRLSTSVMDASAAQEILAEVDRLKADEVPF